VTRCQTCGTEPADIRPDGDCFRCHLRGIAFRYPQILRDYTTREFIDTHVGVDNIRSGVVEKAR
jgi:hypothetical protein